MLNFCKLVFNGVQVHIKQLLLGCKSTSSTSYWRYCHQRVFPPAVTCPTDHLLCSTGECFPARERCDGEPQCPEGSDEHDCLRLVNITSDGGVDVMTGSGFVGLGSDVDSLHLSCALHWDMRKADITCK